MASIPAPGLSDAILTTDHAASSYGIPILVMDGQVYGPDDYVGEVGMTARKWVEAGALTRIVGHPDGPPTAPDIEMPLVRAFVGLQ